MTTGYSVQILEITELTSVQKAGLLAKCKGFLMVEHNELDVVIADLIFKEIKAVERFTSNFLYRRKIQVSVLSVKGILDLPYIPVLRTPAPIFSDSQTVTWGSDNSLIANSTEPVSVIYSAGYSEIPEDMTYSIFETVRIFFDREDKLSLSEKIKAMIAYREYAFDNYRINALISSYV